MLTSAVLVTETGGAPLGSLIVTSTEYLPPAGLGGK